MVVAAFYNNAALLWLNKVKPHVKLEANRYVVIASVWLSPVYDQETLHPYMSSAAAVYSSDL